MNKRIAQQIRLLLPLLVACSPDHVAQAGSYTLSVDEVATLLAEHSRIPPDTQVVRVVAELWVDYTLLADQVHADSTLADLDVDFVTRQPLDEGMLARLQEIVVQVDTVVDDDLLRERFAADMPGAQATASQILLAYPAGASARQQDSVQLLGQSIRDRLDAGESFTALVGQFSSDFGSARRGGSMGTFPGAEGLRPGPHPRRVAPQGR